MKKRAQAAMEFLMTYGWAILVVLAAIGALVYLDVLSADRFAREQCVVADFGCDSDFVSADALQFRLTNNLQADLQNVTVQISSNSCETWDSASYDLASPNLPNRGQTEVISFTCNDAGGMSGVVQAEVTVLFERAGENVPERRVRTGSFIGRVNVAE